MGLKSDTEYEEVPKVMIKAMIEAWNFMKSKGQTKYLLELKDIKLCCHHKYEVEPIENDFLRMLRIEPLGPDHKGGVRRMKLDEQQWQPGAAAASTATAAPRYGKGTFPENTPEQQPPTKGKAAPKGSDSKGSKGKGKGRKDKGAKGPILPLSLILEVS